LIKYLLSYITMDISPNIIIIIVVQKRMSR